MRNGPNPRNFPCLSNAIQSLSTAVQVPVRSGSSFGASFRCSRRRDRTRSCVRHFHIRLVHLLEAPYPFCQPLVLDCFLQSLRWRSSAIICVIIIIFHTASFSSVVIIAKYGPDQFVKVGIWGKTSTRGNMNATYWALLALPKLTDRPFDASFAETMQAFSHNSRILNVFETNSTSKLLLQCFERALERSRLVWGEAGGVSHKVSVRNRGRRLLPPRIGMVWVVNRRLWGCLLSRSAGACLDWS